MDLPTDAVTQWRGGAGFCSESCVDMWDGSHPNPPSA
jgi:hypothetical protein